MNSRNLNSSPQSLTPAAEPAPARRSLADLKPKRLLVPVDFSACSAHALEHARRLAEQFSGRLILLHVMEPPPGLDENNQATLQAERERLEDFGRRHVAHQVPVETLVRMGHAHSEITDTANAMGAELIVLGTHHLGGLAESPAGTAAWVVQHAPCPVLRVCSPEPAHEMHPA